MELCKLLYGGSNSCVVCEYNKLHVNRSVSVCLCVSVQACIPNTFGWYTFLSFHKASAIRSQWFTYSCINIIILYVCDLVQPDDVHGRWSDLWAVNMHRRNICSLLKSESIINTCFWTHELRIQFGRDNVLIKHNHWHDLIRRHRGLVKTMENIHKYVNIQKWHSKYRRALAPSYHEGPTLPYSTIPTIADLSESGQSSWLYGSNIICASKFAVEFRWMSIYDW